QAAVLAIPIHREVASVQRKDGWDVVALGQVDERGVRKLRSQSAITPEKGIDPGQCVRFQGQQGQKSYFEGSKDALHGVGVSPQQPLRFRQNWPASPKRRP